MTIADPFLGPTSDRAKHADHESDEFPPTLRIDEIKRTRSVVLQVLLNGLEFRQSLQILGGHHHLADGDDRPAQGHDVGVVVEPIPIAVAVGDDALCQEEGKLILSDLGCFVDWFGDLLYNGGC